MDHLTPFSRKVTPWCAAGSLARYCNWRTSKTHFQEPIFTEDIVYAVQKMGWNWTWIGVDSAAVTTSIAIPESRDPGYGAFILSSH
jgi:hypothetical protein